MKQISQTNANIFANENNFELLKLVHDCKRGIYRINNVNNYHSLMKGFLRQFRVVSKKILIQISCLV